MTDHELIIAAAEKVMEWKVSPPDEFGSVIASDGSALRWLGQHWNPLESDADAFMLVDAMRLKGWRFRVVESGPLNEALACADFRRNPGESHVAETANRRRSIVLAAVRAAEAGYHGASAPSSPADTATTAARGRTSTGALTWSARDASGAWPTRGPRCGLQGNPRPWWARKRWRRGR